MKRFIFLCCFIPGLVYAATITPGSLANGELCLNSEQCASGACHRNDGMSLARCIAKAKAGEICSSYTLYGVYYKPPCDAGLFCKPDPSVTTDGNNLGICVDFQTLQGECPSGYIEADEPYLIITAGNCPYGAQGAGASVSCLVENPSGNCIMYIPTDMSFTDDTGTYEYTDACPMS